MCLSVHGLWSTCDHDLNLFEIGYLGITQSVADLGVQGMHASSKSIFYRPQRSCGKVMFSQVSVILFTEGGGGGVADTPWADTPAGQTSRAQCMLGYTPPTQCMLRYTPPPSTCWDIRPSRAPLQRTVRIILECILVFIFM